jgi:hypothetical protein
MSAPGLGRRLDPPTPAEAELPADPRYCPECLRPYGTTTQIPTAQQHAAAPWWSWVLVAFGAYLVLAVGPPTWSNYQALQEVRAQLDDLASCPEGGRVQPECSETKRLMNVEASASLLQAYATTSQRYQQEISLAELGGAALAVGLVSVSRRSVARLFEARRTGGWERQPARTSLPLTIVGGAWLATETLVAAMVSLVLAAYGYLLVSRVLAGVPWSWQLTDQTFFQVLSLFLGFAQAILVGQMGPGTH